MCSHLFDGSLSSINRASEYYEVFTLQCTMGCMVRLSDWPLDVFSFTLWCFKVRCVVLRIGCKK